MPITFESGDSGLSFTTLPVSIRLKLRPRLSLPGDFHDLRLAPCSGCARCDDVLGAGLGAATAAAAISGSAPIPGATAGPATVPGTATGSATVPRAATRAAAGSAAISGTTAVSGPATGAAAIPATATA